MKCLGTEDSGRGNWHAIYHCWNESKTRRVDYCREDLSPEVTSAPAARRAAVSVFEKGADLTARQCVDSFTVERW